MNKPRLRTVPETVAFLRMAIANESIHTSLIQTAELSALLDIVEATLGDGLVELVADLNEVGDYFRALAKHEQYPNSTMRKQAIVRRAAATITHLEQRERELVEGLRVAYKYMPNCPDDDPNWNEQTKADLDTVARALLKGKKTL